MKRAILFWLGAIVLCVGLAMYFGILRFHVVVKKPRSEGAKNNSTVDVDKQEINKNTDRKGEVRSGESKEIHLVDSESKIFFKKVDHGKLYSLEPYSAGNGGSGGVTCQGVPADDEKAGDDSDRPLYAVGSDGETFFALKKVKDKYVIEGLVGGGINPPEPEKWPRTSKFGITPEDEKPYYEAIERTKPK